MEIEVKLARQPVRGGADTIQLAQDVFRVCRGEGSHNLLTWLPSKAQPMDSRRFGGLIPVSLVVVKARAYLTKLKVNGTGRKRLCGTDVYRVTVA